MRPKPTCRKCGTPHYNYIACADAPAANAAEAAAAVARAEQEAVTAVRLGHRNEFAGPRSDNYTVAGGGDLPYAFRLKRDDGRGQRWRAA